MSPFFEDGSLAYFVLVIVAGALFSVALRRALRARARQRVVEQPNSHYTSPVVRNGETRHRWQNIDMERVHEANRGEVSRLLERVQASGVDSISERERVFLDQFTTAAAPKAPAAPRDTGRHIASDLQHRPA